MKKRFDKEDFLGLLVIIGSIFLICGWITMFAVFPILGIKEAIKLLLNVPYENYFLVIGNIGALGAIIIFVFTIYEDIIYKIERKISSNKLKKIKRIFWSIIVFLFALIVGMISFILMQANKMIYLSQTIIVLFSIEIVLFAIGLLLFINNYTNKKTKKMTRRC